MSDDKKPDAKKPDEKKDDHGKSGGGHGDGKSKITPLVWGIGIFVIVFVMSGAIGSLGNQIGSFFSNLGAGIGNFLSNISNAIGNFLMKISMYKEILLIPVAGYLIYKFMTAKEGDDHH